MFDRDAARDLGSERYGARNATVKCSRCGAGLGPDGALGVKHGHDMYCVDCAVEKGYADKKDLDNADPSCRCGHRESVHGSSSNNYADSECDISGCECKAFKHE